MGMDGSMASVRHARLQARGVGAASTFCQGDLRTLDGVPDDTFDAAFEAGTLATLDSAEEVQIEREEEVYTHAHTQHTHTHIHSSIWRSRCICTYGGEQNRKPGLHVPPSPPYVP